MMRSLIYFYIRLRFSVFRKVSKQLEGGRIALLKCCDWIQVISTCYESRLNQPNSPLQSEHSLLGSEHRSTCPVYWCIQRLVLRMSIVVMFNRVTRSMNQPNSDAVQMIWTIDMWWFALAWLMLAFIEFDVRDESCLLSYPCLFAGIEPGSISISIWLEVHGDGCWLLEVLSCLTTGWLWFLLRASRMALVEVFDSNFLHQCNGQQTHLTLSDMKSMKGVPWDHWCLLIWMRYTNHITPSYNVTSFYNRFCSTMCYISISQANCRAAIQFQFLYRNAMLSQKMNT